MTDNNNLPDPKNIQSNAVAIRATYPVPAYPPGDDIYNRNKKEVDIDPEDVLKNKEPNAGSKSSNEKEFDEDLTGEDLDIPGAELDDENEAIGSEDEENNYYSIGGDDHNNLDEDGGQ